MSPAPAGPLSTWEVNVGDVGAAADALLVLSMLVTRPDLGTRAHVQASLAKLRKRGLVAIEGRPTAVRLPIGLDGALRELVWHARVRGPAS